MDTPALFTVYNALDAMACCWNLGVPLAECADALAKSHGVKGRMEIIPTPGKDYTILNDYSHKPDALENVLQSVKGFAKGRTVVLFGCGGDRDKTKRPVMGAIAAQLADFVIVTSDNPRTEKPEAIIDDILVGLKGYDTPYAVIPDRVAAIHSASGTPRFQQQAMASSVLYTVNSAGMPTWTWHHSVSASASKSTLPGSSATFFAIRSA